MEFDYTTLEQALSALGQLLLERDQYYEIVAIGGGGLLLLGQIIRTTKDLDLIARVDEGELISADPLPKRLSQAIQEVGVAYNLGKDWINIGPADLFKMGLPDGFKNRMHISRYGGLTIYLAGRFDQICFKLYAAVDQGPTSKHFADLKFLQPGANELEEASRWCITHDVSEGFSNDLAAAIAALKG